MPTNALANPLVLPILGLLTERSLHGYGLYAQLRDRYDHLPVRRSSVYTLLDRLVDAGWLERSGDSAPSRYAITPAGSTALADGVVRELRDAPLGPSAAFTTALAYLGILSRTEAATLLEERRSRTREALEGVRTTLGDYPGPELQMIEAHYQAAALSHDAQWLHATIRRIRSGDLAWPPGQDHG